MGQPRFEPSGFFALRTPLLPFDELIALGHDLRAPQVGDDPAALAEAVRADARAVRARLAEQIARPEVQEAIFLASPALADSLEVWRRDPGTEHGQKIERSLVRYFTRMAARSTPFGLFAGCAVGRLDAATRLELAPRERCRRTTRLDMYYLCALTETLASEPALRAAVRYRPSSSLYRIAGQLRYIEARTFADERTYHLAAVEPTPYLEATLARAAGGAQPSVLAAALCTDDPEIELAEAARFVDALIDQQVIVPILEPAITGGDAAGDLIGKLATTGVASPVTDRLGIVVARLAELDRQGLGNAPDAYRDIAAELSALPAPVDLPRLFQVDLVKTPVEASLGRNVIAELSRAVELLYRVTPPQDDPLAGFREAFSGRYGDQEVPLLVALDEEDGVGFEATRGPAADPSPLLAGLQFPARGVSDDRFGARDAHLLRLLERAWAGGATTIELGERDVAALSTADRAALPDAFAAMATLEAPSVEHVDRGEFRLWVDHVAGPSGALLLGRFCHADRELAEAVGRHLADEQAHRPDAIFAEIVHLPEGRIGNIVARPVLRDHELCFLGNSGAPAERQILLDDLTVSIVDDRIVVRSRRLGREIIPRLTTAHNYVARSLGAYRFLCALQRQHVAPPAAWTWGALDHARFLPRVVSGKSVLSPARWKLGRDEIAALGHEDRAAEVAAVARLRSERGLTRFVALAEGDNVLPIDLDNVLSVDMFVHLVRSRDGVELIEVPLGAHSLCATGPDGRFTHELVVPFRRSAQQPVAARETPAPRRVPRELPRTLPPGSDWLYATLHCGPATADRVLVDLVAPVVEAAMASGAVDRWFFIRYGDPEWHLRVRFHGAPDRLHGELLPLLERAAAPLIDHGQLARWRLDTYDREIERYGGDEAMAPAEAMFHADSEAALAIVRVFAGDSGAEARAMLALRGMDLLLDDLGLSLEQRRVVATSQRQAFGRELAVDTALERQLGMRYRHQRVMLDELFDGQREPTHPYRDGLAILRVRSRAIAPVAAQLRALEADGRLTMPLAEIALSYVHMQINRMIRSSPREHELVLYDALARIYDARIARARPTRRPAG